MQDNQTPAKFVLPFAASAAGPYVRDIPKASQIGVQNGAASLTDGFPPLTFIDLSAGGAGPFGEDMNGLFKQITAGLRWLQASGPNYYDSAFATDSSVGGYPLGAVLPAVGVAGKFWLSTAENNTSNPDTGGANWLALYMPNAATILGVASGGTGDNTLAAGQILIGAGTSPIASIPTLDVPRGGTGRTALASNEILIGNGAGGILSVPKLGITQTPTQLLFATTIQGSGTFVVPPNTTSIFCLCVAGGGGGAMVNGSNPGGGGGAGGAAYGWFGVSPGDFIPWVIGQGGAGGTAGDDGHIGSMSSIFTFVSATPGQQGSSVANSGGGLGGFGTGGAVNLYGGMGRNAVEGNPNNIGGDGGASYYGGGSRATPTIIPPYAAPGSGGGGSYGAAALSAGNVGLAGAIEIWG